MERGKKLKEDVAGKIDAIGQEAEKRKGAVRKHTKETKVAVRKAAREKARKWRRMMGVKHMCVGAVTFALLAAGISYSGIIEKADQMVSDLIYQAIATKRSNSRIRIIAIDEKTVKSYGNYKDWSRTKTVDLLNQLNSDKTKSPSVIGIDLDYSDEKDSEGDESLVDVCSEYKNICFSASAVMEGDQEADGMSPEQRVSLSPDVTPQAMKIPEGEQPSFVPASGNDAPNPIDGMMNGIPIERIVLPFESLLNQVTVGIVNNTRNSDDGFVRNAISSIYVNGVEMDSFATAIYKKYMDSMGREYTLPKLDEEGGFNFTYSRKSQDYTVYSFADVLEGDISKSAFEDSIVFVGDYTEDTTFKVPNQRKTQMHEVEMQANILEALLEQRTGQQVSKLFMAVFYAFFIAVYFVATSYSSGKWTVVIATVINLVQLLSCCALNLFGYYINILVPLIMVVIISIYNFIVRYAIAIQNQYAMEDVFKKYVDESVISELGKSGLIEAHIGVVSKDIAVLFVDIRGFTALSESLPPEQIVEILNDYLELVAEAVAKYQGTLDKFIGDAAMAVFNSPVDLEDYEYRAVCAALELCSNAEELNEKCKEEYGKQVAFGIGIQCGEAVIGNIGCEIRMDYTAIGDTVNTASRLEGAAAPGQILISQEMANRLKGRILTTFVGEYALKGKKNPVPVYEVNGVTVQEE